MEINYNKLMMKAFHKFMKQKFNIIIQWITNILMIVNIKNHFSHFLIMTALKNKFQAGKSAIKEIRKLLRKLWAYKTSIML
jgi:hypothetical protein